MKWTRHPQGARPPRGPSLTGFQTWSGQTVLFYRSAINSHSDAAIMPQLCHSYGILQLFCEQKRLS